MKFQKFGFFSNYKWRNVCSKGARLWRLLNFESLISIRYRDISEEIKQLKGLEAIKLGFWDFGPTLSTAHNIIQTP